MGEPGVTHTKQVTIRPWGSRTLHFHSKWAGRLGGTGNCVSPNATDIYVAGDKINQMTLTHEFGHGERAVQLGYAYKPQIAWRFLLALDWKHPFAGGVNAWLQEGYRKSKAEREPDEFMWANYQAFPLEVRCDCAE